MSALQHQHGSAVSAVDAPPVNLPSPSRRPRLLSYIGRWGRARRWLPADARLVVDVGCAFGYGTAALSAGRSGRFVGIEPDPDHVRRAARFFPWLTVLEASATALPFDDGSVDAVVMLDVLEHVPDRPAVLAEIHRVLRPGGSLVLTVPHRGLLARLDSLNVYPALRRRFPSWGPLEPADETGPEGHRHFAQAEIAELFGDRFAIERSTRTGLGLAELVHLSLLVAFRGVFWLPWLYRAILPLHFIVYLVDDLVPLGPAGYHLAVRATAIGKGGRS